MELVDGMRLGLIQQNIQGNYVKSCISYQKSKFNFFSVKKYWEKETSFYISEPKELIVAAADQTKSQGSR